MRSSELAGQVGVNPETLRYYERRGPLHQPPRTASGYRNYPAAAVTPLEFIKRAQQLGFTLDDVEELLHLDQGGPRSCDAARELAQARRGDLEARIADPRRMRDALTELISTRGLPRSDRGCALLAAREEQSSGAPAPAGDRSRTWKSSTLPSARTSPRCSNGWGTPRTCEPSPGRSPPPRKRPRSAWPDPQRC